MNINNIYLILNNNIIIFISNKYCTVSLFSWYENNKMLLVEEKYHYYSCT